MVCKISKARGVIFGFRREPLSALKRKRNVKTVMVEVTTEFAKPILIRNHSEFVEWINTIILKPDGIAGDHRQPIAGVSHKILDQRGESDSKGRFEFRVPARDNCSSISMALTQPVADQTPYFGILNKSGWPMLIPVGCHRRWRHSRGNAGR